MDSTKSKERMLTNLAVQVSTELYRMRKLGKFQRHIIVYVRKSSMARFTELLACDLYSNYGVNCTSLTEISDFFASFFGQSCLTVIDCADHTDYVMSATIENPTSIYFEVSDSTEPVLPPRGQTEGITQFDTAAFASKSQRIRDTLASIDVDFENLQPQSRFGKQSKAETSSSPEKHISHTVNTDSDSPTQGTHSSGSSDSDSSSSSSSSSD